MNLGGAEVIVILAIVLMLFGPALIAFWLGYTIGKRTSADGQVTPPAAAPDRTPPTAESTADETAELAEETPADE